MVTEDAGDPSQNQLSVKLGRYDRKELNLSYSGAVGDLKWHATFAHEASDITERYIETDAQTIRDSTMLSQITPPASNAPGFINDWYKASHLLFKTEYQAYSLEFHRYLSDAGDALGVTDSLEPAEAPIGNYQYDHTALKLSYQLNPLNSAIPGALKTEFSYEDGHIDSYFMVFPPGAVLLIGDDGDLFSAGGYPAELVVVT